MGPTRLKLGIAYLSFFGMGLGGGLLAVAWPSARDTFGVSLGAIGTLFICDSAGYLLFSLPGGRLISRFGLGAILVFSAVARGVGLLGYAVAPTWLALLPIALFSGVGTGALDTGLNTYFAANCRPSHTNWLHASCGLGAMTGPALMIGLLSAGLSWRVGYGIAAAVQGILVIAFALTVHQWQLSAPSSHGSGMDARTAPVRSRDTLRIPIVWFLLGLFFVATGIEVTAGQWPYTLFTEERAIAPATASFWASVYFGSVMLGRLLLGTVVDRLSLYRTLRTIAAAALVGAILLWWNVAEWVGFAGLVVLGLAIGPVFSLLVSSTQSWVGADNTPNAIGFGMTAAVVGVAALMAVAGWLAATYGLETLGPYLAAACALLLLLHEVAIRVGRSSASEGEPSSARSATPG